MSDIVWEDPPETSVRGSSGYYEEFAAELRRHPKRWAQLPTRPGKKQNLGAGTAIRQGRFTAFRPVGEFEAVWRSGATYVRYVGENGEL